MTSHHNTSHDIMLYDKLWSLPVLISYYTMLHAS